MPGGRAAAEPAIIEVARGRGLTAVGEASLRRRLGTVLAVVGGTRVLLFCVMAIATPAPPPLQALSPFVRETARLFSGSGLLERLFLPWARWDGLWYVEIAAHGYSRPWSEAFYPLYPSLIRLVSPVVGGNYAVAGVLISMLLLLAAAALLYYLVSLDFGPPVAFWTTVYVSTFPTSFFFQAVYADSLFLLLAVACILLCRQDRWALAGLAGMLATITRSTGLLLLVPMTILYLSRTRGYRWRIDRSVLWLLLVPAGIAVWMGYLWVAVGDATASFTAEGHWGRTFAVPVTAVYRGFADAFHHFDVTVIDGRWGTGGLHDMLAALVLAGWATLIWLGRRRISPAYTAMAIALLIVPLCFPGHERPLFSLPRLALTAFPALITLALLTSRRLWLRIAIAALFLAANCWLACEFARHVFIA